MRLLNIDAKHALRSGELASRWDTIIRELKHSNDGANAESLANEIQSLLAGSSDKAVLRYWRLAERLLRALALDMAIRVAAKSPGTDLTPERTRLQVLLNELDESVAELEDEHLEKAVRSSYDVATVQITKKALLAAVCNIPLPTLYHAEEQDSRQRPVARETNVSGMVNLTVLRLTAFLDDAPVSVTQQIRPHTLHTLRFQVKGIEWPKEAAALRIELLSTCPATLFHVSTFETRDHVGAGEFDAALSGTIQLNASQSDKAPDLIVSVRATFVMKNGSVLEAPVVGHNQLRFRAIESVDSATDRKALSQSPAYLPPNEFTRLQNVLFAAFDRQSLRQMLRAKMGIRLDQIAGNGNFVDVICDVIEWAERESRVDNLVVEAAAFVPANAELKQLANEFQRN